ncbi:MAG TPA: hypothetical protein V6C63_21450 [Allocoleopsis sp.]
MRDIKAIRDRYQIPRQNLSGEELQRVLDIGDLLAEIDELNEQISVLRSSQKTTPYQTGS